MKYLHPYGIYHNNIKRALFDNFLLQMGHEHYLQDFFIFCATLDTDRLGSIVKAFEFHIRGGYTYGRLFNIHPGWATFFKENAHQSGKPHPHDIRLGVDQAKVDAIMRCYTETGESDSLDIAILNYHTATAPTSVTRAGAVIETAPGSGN